MDLTYSDKSTVKNAVAVIWDDNHQERSGFFRAFWCAKPDSSSGSPVFGYCDSKGSYRTIRQVVPEFKRYYPGERIFRNNREM
jgi:hypothetical protein